MTLLEKVLSGGIEAAVVVIAIGLIVRGRWRLSWAFDATVLAILVISALNTWWPSRFHQPGVWLIGQTAFDLLKFCVALELGWRTFRPFPGARKAALRAALMVLVVTAAIVGAVPLAGPGSSAYEISVVQFHPRVIVGTVWLMVAVLALARWYRVPVHPFHASILTSLASYAALFLSLLSLRAHYGPDHLVFLNQLDAAVSLLLMGWWLHVTWRPESATAVAHVSAMRQLELGASA